MISGNDEKKEFGEETEARKPRRYSSNGTSTTDDPAGAAQGRGSYGNQDRGGYDSGGYQGDRGERPKAGAMEVMVDSSIEKAMKILKRKLIKEGLFKELKSRRYFEKPSERKKRKQKESVKKARKEEARNKRNQGFFS